MTDDQLNQIKKFSQKYYSDTDHYHNWNHILLTRHYAFRLAEGNSQINKKTLEAACYLHDIGRSVKDEGHPAESAKIAQPFLKEIGLSEEEIERLLDAFSYHEVEKIDQAKTVEAEVLFDADKIQILSVAGFIGVAFFLVEKRQMPLSEAIAFLWTYSQKIRANYLHSDAAREIVDKELVAIKRIAESFENLPVK